MAEDQPLTVILIHNRYVYRGGEDSVFEAEAELLEQHGCRVHRMEAQSKTPANLAEALQFAASATWSAAWYERTRELANAIKPDVIHVHNFFPNISPSVLYAAAETKVPVVLTLHNFRLLCPRSDFFRQDRVCEECMGKRVPWPAVLHGCYRGSRTATSAVCAMISMHRLWGTWARRVAIYIALSQFSRDTLIRGGIPADRVVVKPNFAPDLARSTACGSDRSGALFVGRLSREKGIDTLLDAWLTLGVPLQILGDGPLEQMVRGANLPSVIWLGRRSKTEVAAAMRRAEFVVVPSKVYENFPMTIVEAFCSSTPVITSQLGAMAEIVKDGVTGLHFRPGDANGLADRVRWARDHRSEMHAMGRNARRLFEERYSPDSNYTQLRSIYAQAVKSLTGQHKVGGTNSL